MSKVAIAKRLPPLHYSLRMKRKETEEMAKLYRAGYSCGEIAALHKISKQAVHGRLVRHGVIMRDWRGREKATA